MKPVARTDEGDPLWLTGEVRKADHREWYWTPKGPKRSTQWSGTRREWPILTLKPRLPDPYLTGRIDQALKDHGYDCVEASRAFRALVREARKHVAVEEGGA